MAEVWKPVPGYPGFEASSRGRVRSLDRYVEQTNRWGKKMLRKHRGHLLAQRIDRYGYCKLSSRQLKETMAHRVIALAFHANPESKPQVNHINGIKTDNRPENLEWCTNSENHLHAYRVLGQKPPTPKGKPVELVRDGATLWFDGTKTAAQALNVGRTAIMNAAKSGYKSKGWAVRYV